MVGSVDNKPYISKGLAVVSEWGRGLLSRLNLVAINNVETVRPPFNIGI